MMALCWRLGLLHLLHSMDRPRLRYGRLIAENCINGKKNVTGLEEEEGRAEAPKWGVGEKKWNIFFPPESPNGGGRLRR